MMHPLNRSGLLDSSALRKVVEGNGCQIMHYECNLYIDGEQADIDAVEAALTGFDYEAGVFADTAKRYEQAIQKFMDEQAQAAGYDDLISACSYAAAANPYQAESQGFLVWRGAVWDYAFTELQKVQTGTRTQPTIAEFIAELPARA